MSYQVFAIRSRPQNFDEVVGQEPVIQALKHALKRQKLHHAYLFTGTRGVGKTTIARILAKAMNCEQGVSEQPCNTCANCVAITEGKFPDLIEIDAASKTKVEDTRALLDTVIYSPTQGRYKIYLIDEVHMLSTHSFNALLKTLEEPPEHVKFLLATTEQQKIPATILSRCLQFTLKWVNEDVISEHLRNVLSRDGIESEPEALDILASAAQGSVRDSLSLLEQAVAHGAGKVYSDQVRNMLGTVKGEQVIALIKYIVSRDSEGLFLYLHELSAVGIDFTALLNQLIYSLHNIAIIQQAPGIAEVKQIDSKPALIELSDKITPEDIQIYYQMALLAKRDLPYSPQPKLALEMVLLRMMNFVPVQLGATERKAPAPLTQQTVSHLRDREQKQFTKEKQLVENKQDVQKTPLTSTKESVPSRPASISTHSAPDRGDNPRLASIMSDNVSTNGELPNSSNWHEWLNNLGLTGLHLQIVKNTEFVELDSNKLVLKFDNRVKALVNQKRIEEIEAKLKDLMKKDIKLELTGAHANVNKVTNNQDVTECANTPAKLEASAKQEKKESLIAKMQNDPNINKIMQTFDGELKLDSIEVLDD